ncbi:hypothetical protein HY498_05835 [Candidatus Woesearchaeota archaeon]|nr:hypothetical protein [Candidatus Woesearchaeota archaeon]
MHLESLKELFEEIAEGIEKGIEKRQKIIGFCTSSACVDLLEILLHKNNLIDPGFIVKHQWLKSKNKLKEKLPFDFPNKKEILDLIFKIEEKRDILCYDKPQNKEIIQETINNLNILKEKFHEAGLDEI